MIREKLTPDKLFERIITLLMLIAAFIESKSIIAINDNGYVIKATNLFLFGNL